jgi:hypothetical protein
MTVLPNYKYDDQVDSTAQFLDWLGHCNLRRDLPFCRLSLCFFSEPTGYRNFDQRYGRSEP